MTESPINNGSTLGASLTELSNALETQPENQYIQKEKLQNEEFKIWKKTVPMLYETIHTYVLDTPSLTVQSVPGYELSADKITIKNRLFTGTFNVVNDDDNEFVRLHSLRLPSTLSSEINNKIPVEDSFPVISKFQEDQKWRVKTEVNRIRYNPHTQQTAAFLGKSGDICILSKDLDYPSRIHTAHSSEGFAMEWSHDGKYLLTGAEDAFVVLWDVNKDSPVVKCHKNHQGTVNDVAWSYSTPSLFASVSDDRSIIFQDHRVSSQSPLYVISNAHDEVVTSIDFNPSIPWNFVTGGGDNTINVWDIRSLDTPIRSLYGHHGGITQLRFDPNNGTFLASSANDRRIHIWDLTRIEESFSKDDFLKGRGNDPTLKFVHGGHNAKINEFDWVKGVKNTLVSVGEDSLLEVWKPSLFIERIEDEDEDQILDDVEEIKRTESEPKDSTTKKDENGEEQGEEEQGKKEKDTVA